MSKYINANKLIKSVDNYQEGARAALNLIDGHANYYNGKIDACKDIKWLITSLQQKQPESGCSEKPNNLREQPELDVDTLREWSMRYAPDIRPAIESTAYHFWNKALNARKEV